MRDFKIGTRLAIAFSIVILIVLTFSAFACLKVANFTTADQAQKATLPAAYLSADLRSNVQRQSALFQRMLLTADHGDLDRLDAELAAERSRNAEALAKFEALPLNEKLQMSVLDVKAARDSYAAALDAALPLMRAGTDEAKQRAFEMDTQTVRSTYDH